MKRLPTSEAQDVVKAVSSMKEEGGIEESTANALPSVAPSQTLTNSDNTSMISYSIADIEDSQATTPSQGARSC